jgi:NADH:ubiquinone reductase (H+-translocating)
VTSIEPDCVRLGEERLETRTAIWAAGVQASEAARWLGVEADRVGRVKVTDHLTLPEHPEIFVIGDTALVQDAAGRPVPGLAPAAKEQGRYVADAIEARLKDRPTRPFRYRHLGNLATIGRRSAVIEFGRFRLTGFLAWLLWGAAHIFFLIGFRNRIVVTIDWLWSYLRFGGGARLITGIKPE